MVVGLFLNNWIQIEPKKIIQSSVFLGGLYLLLYFMFLCWQKKHHDKVIIIFLILLVIKFAFIFGFLLLELNPIEAENKNIILLFLITYIVLLVVDIVIKVELMK